MVKCRVNERRYEFGDSYGADDWVCAKIPHDGRIKKDCVPKVYKADLQTQLSIHISYFREMLLVGMFICWRIETSR